VATETGQMKTLLIVIALVACATVHAEEVVPTAPRLWLDSFEAYKASIRVLDSAKTRDCEALLYEILRGIDDHASCATSADCTLLSQDPFGRSVPVRVDYSRTLSGGRRSTSSARVTTGPFTR
jgi:hypothetical protein